MVDENKNVGIEESDKHLNELGVFVN